ncbi:MAG: beta-ketoacyl synthase chain length factor [Gammaproteobacteria bacterium]|nr:beta-ketoacyl synthase chain length factor [Gammaproteobacteria bacterium]
MTNTVALNVVDWHAWAPGLNTTDAWAAWLKVATPGQVPPIAVDTASEPDVSAIPAMLRRRLSPLYRAALAVAYALGDKHGPMPTIFCSRHGDNHKTVELLKALAEQMPLSPTGFSLSVHNAAVGQYTIARQEALPSNAIAAGESGLEHACIEAAGFLAEGRYPQVLVLMYDDILPEVYRNIPDSVACRYALGLVLSAAPSAVRLELQLTTAASLSHTAIPEPSAFSLLRLLTGNATQVDWQDREHHWHWQYANA